MMIFMKIEGKASEAGANEALRVLYKGIGAGFMIMLPLLGLASFIWALSALV